MDEAEKESRKKNFFKSRVFIITLLVLLSPFILGMYLWCALALRFSNLPWDFLGIAAAWGFALAVPAAFIFFKKRMITVYCSLGLCVFIIIWHLLIPASHERDWTRDVSKLPRVEYNDSLVTVHNIRDFDYITENDYKVRYEKKTYDLDKLETLDFALSHWDNIEQVAHFILSFGFQDGQHLCVSVETRREKGEPQTFLRGIFKQYELIYILAEERDVLRLRTNFRKEEVYLYPTTTPREKIRILFDIVMKRVNEINENPEFYNSISHNCLTSLIRDYRSVMKPVRKGFDIRRLMSGYFDELAYEEKVIKTDLSLEETKKLHHINQYVQDDDDPKNYSIKIRPHLKKKD